MKADFLGTLFPLGPGTMAGQIVAPLAIDSL